MPDSSAPSLLVSNSRSTASLGDIDSERLERFLAFGIDIDPSLAEQQLDDMSAARRRWVEEFGLDEPSDDDLQSLLRECVRRSLDRARRQAPGRALTMGVSGGYDSRPLLWLLHELNEEPVLYTYGQPGNIDFDVVGVLDRHLQLGIHRFDSNSLTWRLDDFDAEALLTHDLPLSPRVPTGRAIDELTGDRIDVHGFLNGALSGAGSSPDHLPPDAQIDAFLAGNDPFSFQSILGRERVRALVPMEAVRPDRALSTYRQLDLAFRQWQRIKLVSRPERHMVFPYLDHAWAGFWLSRPLEQIENQRRWLRFVRSLPTQYFPDLDGLEGDRWPLRRARLERLYGNDHEAGWSPVPDGITAPANPTHHFSLIATARNNPSFAAMLTESLTRLRGRHVVDAALIDQVEQRFAADDATAARMMNGLVTLDTCLESGRFSREHRSGADLRGGAEARVVENDSERVLT